MMGVLSNKIEREELKAGDHVYSWRTAYIYAHHGIYVGDGMVIHFTRAGGQETGTGTFLDRILFSSSPVNTVAQCERCGDQSRLHGVISSCIDCFLGGGNLYLFHYGVSRTSFIAKARGGTCTLAASDASDVVLHRANYLLNNGFGSYNIFRNNCEDFAVYCKTGLIVKTRFSVGRSGQLTSLKAAVDGIFSSPLRYLATSPAGLAVVATLVYTFDRYVTDVGFRPDVIMIDVERLAEQLGTQTFGEAQEAAAEGSNAS